MNRLVALAALLTLIGCGDDSKESPREAGAASDLAADATTYPDYGIPLYKCTNPGKACNAHNPCAVSPICSEDGWCRPTSVQNCDDGLACTKDICLGAGQCKYEVYSNMCKLAVRVPKGTTCKGLKSDAGVKLDSGVFPEAGVGSDAGATPGGMETITCCFDPDQRNPADPCKKCTPNAGDGGIGSATSWSSANGGSCTDGDACTMNDTCKAGTCQGTSYASKCSDSIACTKDLCDGKGGCLGNPIKSDACLIDKKCYKAKDHKPSGACATCDPTKSQTAWTPTPKACHIDSKCYKDGDMHAGGCATCKSATSTTAWTVTNPTTDCLLKGKCAKMCGGTCTDITSDPKHCGTCNSPCASGKFCVQSKCVSFTPAQASPGNLVLWLSADKGVTSSGGKVTKWADQSTNGLDATATTGYEPTLVASAAKLGNQPALQMSKSFFSCGNSKKFDIATPSIFVVAAGVSTGIMITKPFGSPGNGWRRLELTHQFFRAGGDKHKINHGATVANPNVYALVSASNTSHTVSINGTATKSTAQFYHSPFTKAEFKIGGSKAGLSSLYGQLAEIIIYKAALADTARKKVECYLGAKYKITVSGCP